MKRLLGIILGISFLVPSVFTNAIPSRGEYASAEAAADTVLAVAAGESSVAEDVDLGLTAKAAYMMDWASGTEIYAQNAEARIPIASMWQNHDADFVL